MKRSLFILAVIASLTAPIRAAESEITLDVKEKTLSNGMRILVVENHLAPVMSTYIRFRVGGTDEHNGISGTSHLLEHMLFKGTKIIGTTDYKAEAILMKKIDSLALLLRDEKAKLRKPLSGGSEERVKAVRDEIAKVQAEQAKFIIKDELWETYLKNGGSGLNASTSADGTQYYVSLPSNRLELWAFLEADRIANLQLREFYSERDVVREERRLRYETQPQGRLVEAIYAASHWSSPYKWQAIGWGADIENVMREDVEKYFRTYYSPSNAIACVVGDVKAEEVFAVCEKYLGVIPRTPPPPPVYTDNSPQLGERTVEIEFDANSSAVISWHMPQAGHPDIAALDVLSDILSRGRTARFYKAFTEKKLASVSAGSAFSRFPSLFTCWITPMGNHTIDELLPLVYAEIDRVKVEPVAQWEIDKVRTQADADFVRSLGSNIGIARSIGNMEAVVGNWNYVTGYRDEIKKVTPDDILRVAGAYLTKKNRTVAKLVRPDGDSPDMKTLSGK